MYMRYMYNTDKTSNPYENVFSIEKWFSFMDFHSL